MKDKKEEIKVKKNTIATQKKRELPEKNKNFPIVALGGSAGSFVAFEKFFRHMPLKSGIGFVIIMHLDPNHKARVSELIQNFTAMPVKEAEDGMTIKPNNVYVIPPNKDLGLHNGDLLLLNPGKPKGYRMPIDYFFQSLAEDQWSKAVGIIFSGMGSDGETGIRMIKEKLGMAMVQDPETAQYASMPNSSIGTNLVDYIASPEEMPVKLIRYLKHPAMNEDTSAQAISDSKNTHAYQKVLMMLRSQTGHDFTQYKKNTITRRIDRRIAFHQLNDYPDYVNHLRENPGEISILFNELLIGVTKFFRDAAAFDSLKNTFQKYLKEKKDGDFVRVWIPGCSTGEEAYSIAILLMELLESLNIKSLKIQIFATDLDVNAIEHARQGLYLDNIVADVSQSRIEKYFVKQNQGYLVKKELRELIVFAQHNIIKDAPFTRLDLLSCRNLLIYLNTDLQKKVIPVFHYSLNTKGLLLLGPAETVGGFSDLFQPVDAKWKIMEKKEEMTTNNRLVDFPFNISNTSGTILKAEVVKPTKKSVIQDYFSKVLLENYTPPSVLIDEKGDILFVNGKPNRYLGLPTGEISMNIHKMIREELKYGLANAIHQAHEQKGTVILRDVKIKDEKITRQVTLKIAYLQDRPLEGSMIVIFEDGGVLQNKKRNAATLSPPAIVQEMEKQLTYTKQQLHTTIEQMETSLEELKSTNEELQSTNEELQSTNEESLTTKEEMQSLNEELMTINMQYQAKAEELTQLNNDMKNLLDTTDTGTIFLDNNLDILRFTPQVKNIFHVIQSDIGRSITHLVSNLEHANLEKDIREVIDRLTRKEFDVRTKKGEWYCLGITPYRTLNNFISGAVLTFKQITPLKELEGKYSIMERSVIALAELHNDAVIVLDDNHKVVLVNKIFLSQFKIKEQEIVHQSFAKFADQKWKTKKIGDFLLKIYEKSEVEISVRTEGYARDLQILANPVYNHSLTSSALMLVIKIKA